MAAIANVILAIAEAGTKVVTLKFLFGNTYSLFEQTLKPWGLQVSYVDMTNPAELEAAVDDRTRAVFLETITNPQLQVADMRMVTRIAQEKNVPVIVDGTVTTPYLFRSRDYGVAVEVISSTKSISGGATAVGEVVIDNGVFDWNQNPKVRPWAQKYGPMGLLVFLLGNLSNENAIALADFLTPFGEDVLRATLDQNLSLRNIPEAFLGSVYEVVKNFTPLAVEPRFLGTSVACTGASTCKLGICLPRGALAAVLKRLKASNLDLDRVADLQMNLSGCPNTCGAHMAADLGFFGKVARKGQTPYPAYGIVVGGTLGNGAARMAEPAGEVSARDLPAFVTDFLHHYLNGQLQFSSFSEYLERQGKQFIRTWCEQHREIPDFDEDKNYYYDWTATDVFSLASRGIGECSAGLFDLIDFDLKRLKEIRGQLPALSNGPRAEALYQITLSAARMLLINRAIEPRSDTEVFAQFRRHFIAAGLVAGIHLPLVETAEKKDLPGIEARVDEVLSLARTMEELYGAMDNSLRFPGETAKAPVKTPPNEKPQLEPVISRDLRGVACPMNFVRTKLALESLTAGQRLRILLDDGAPIQNVPRSVVGEGHRILEQVKAGEHWSVLIEKS